MELISILNHCDRHRGFIDDHAGVSLTARGSTWRSDDGRLGGALLAAPPTAPGYDQLPERRGEFIPLWGSTTKPKSP
jgi:hypothetical protein